MNNKVTAETPGTDIVEMPCIDTDSQANLLNGARIMCPLTAEQAVNKYVLTEKRLAHYELATTYTVGFEGVEEHIWDYSHYEIYEPMDKSLPSLLVLRYRRRHFKQIDMMEEIATV